MAGSTAEEMEAWRKDPAAAAGALQQASADGDTATLTRMLQMGVGADSPNQVSSIQRLTAFEHFIHSGSSFKAGSAETTLLFAEPGGTWKHPDIYIEFIEESAGEGPPQWERAECDLFDFTREEVQAVQDRGMIETGQDSFELNHLLEQRLEQLAEPVVDALIGGGALVAVENEATGEYGLKNATGLRGPAVLMATRAKTVFWMGATMGADGCRLREGEQEGSSWKNARTPLPSATDRGEYPGHATLLDIFLSSSPAFKQNLQKLAQRHNTPLHLAASNGHTTVVEALVKGGAFINAKDADEEVEAPGLLGGSHHIFWHQRSPVEEAIVNGHTAAVDILLCKTALHLAVANGSSEILHTLIQAGAAVNEGDMRHRTPLHLAAALGNTEAATTLIQVGALVNALDMKRNTSLHLAALNGHLETVQALIAAGADIHAKNSREESPLHLAACGGAVPVLEALITAGALAHVVDKEGCTPLHLAAYKGRTKAAEALLTLGADLQAQGQVQSGLRRFQPWQEIAVVPPGAVVEYMDPDAWMRGADKKPPPSGFVKGEVIAYDEANDTHILVTRERDGEKVDDTKEMKLTLKNVQFKLFAKDGVTAVLNGMTPLMLAACKGQTTTIDFLIKSGADIHLSTQHGYTPLHYAAKQGHTSAVAALITAGADIHAKDMQHRTALHVAVNNGHLATGEQLVAAGADDQAQDVDGETPAAALATQKAEEKNAPSKNTEASTVVMLKVSGAKLDVNGEYTQDGVHNGKPKYKSVEGHIIYFAGVWKMNDVDDTDAWYYTSMACGSLHFVHVRDQPNLPPLVKWTADYYCGDALPVPKIEPGPGWPTEPTA
eukprot:gene4846-5916_t